MRTDLFITENSGCQIYKQPVVAGHGTLCGRPIGIIYKEKLFKALVKTQHIRNMIYSMQPFELTMIAVFRSGNISQQW